MLFLCIILLILIVISHGDQDFSVYAPKLWNSLPQHMKCGATNSSLETYQCKVLQNFQMKCYINIIIIIIIGLRFQVMADFQYLVPDMPDFLAQVKDGDALNQDIPLHLPPPVFARFDNPADYNYRPEPQTGKGSTHAVKDNEEDRY